MASRIEYPKFSAFDANGDPLSGGKVYTYKQGTSTAKATWTTPAKASLNDNPVILDSNGEADIYGEGAYKIILKTAGNALIWTLDNIMGASSLSWTALSDYASLSAAVAAIGATERTLFIDTDDTMAANVTVPSTLHLSFLKGSVITLGNYTLTINGPLTAPVAQIFNESGTGAVTFGAGYLERIYPQWWGATGDGVTDDSTAFYDAIVAAAGKPVFVPPGTYLLSTISSKTFDTDIILIGLDPETTILDGNSDQSFYMVKTGYDSHKVHFYGLKFQNFDIALACQATANIITHLKVDDCFFYSCNYAGIKAYCKVGSAEITNSRFDTIGPSSEAHGIVLGADVYASQDSMTKYIIKGNKFKDITATASPNPARAILCYGREVIITDNLIENIEVGTAEDDAEGIYVKARFSNISDNVLIDAGSHQGWITIKGSSRGVTSSPQGFANVVANNNLYSTNDSDNDSGIFISNDSVLVVGNHLEGFNNVGIYTGGTELDDIAIIGNKITRTRGAKGISLANYGRNLQVHDNQITGLLGTKAGLTDSYGIYLYQTYGDLSNVSIQDNQIDENDESSITGIIWGIYCRVYNTRTIENLVIQNNQINIVHSTEAERCLQIVCDAGGTIDGLKMKNNQLSADGTPLTLTFTGTVSGFVYEPMELGITADMAGHETFTVNDGRVFIKDPDGGARNFNPSGEFPDAYQVTLVNTADAAEAITFDSAGLNQAVAQNERGIFVYTGAAWLTVYVG